MNLSKHIAWVAFALLGTSVLADDGERPGNAAMLPAYFLEIPENVDDVLVAIADSATMYRYSRNGSRIVEQDQRYMSIGTNGVGKQRAWDKKTPLGVYFITERLDTTKLHDKYGVAAFPLDYPNAWDLHNERTGDGIWLHGVDHKNPDRPPLDTDGCLALPNEEILALAEDLRPLTTPVVVTRNLRMATTSELESTRLEFRVALDMWRDSLEKGDISTFLAMYAEEFSYREMDKSQWGSWRMAVFDANPLSSVHLSDLMLMADPEVDDLFMSRFTQVLETENGPITTVKRLYWKRSEGNVWRIVSEGNG